MTGREPYLSAAEALLRESGCIVRRWRSRSTGIAYTESVEWEIEVPEPRGPVSFATFAHEVGHQMLHRRNSKPRWREELEAWEYALAQFERFGLPGEDRARADAAKSLARAAEKAVRRSRRGSDLAREILLVFPEWAADEWGVWVQT